MIPSGRRERWVVLLFCGLMASSAGLSGEEKCARAESPAGVREATAPDGPSTKPAQPDGERILRKEVVVSAPLEEVWRAWTTSEGMAEFFAPKSHMEIRVGGPYEIYIQPDAPEGSRGCEGCQILAYAPQRMLAFEWLTPPSIPSLREAGARLQVVLILDRLGPDHTRVDFAMLGWGDGEDWEKCYAYFDRAWGWVLGRLKDRFEPEMPSELGPPEDGSQPDSWIDGHVTVTEVGAPYRRQDFEVILPAAVPEVWHALTTSEGMADFVAPDARIELEPGGAYEIFSGSGSRVQAFVPHEMLAVTGSAPLEFPTVRMGGTWAVLEFADTGEGRTFLHMSVMGWREGDEWDRAFEYFLKNNAVFLNLLYKRFAEGPLKWSDGDPRTFTRVPLEDAEQAPSADETGPDIRRMDEEIIVPATLAGVWKAFTTPQGLETWAAPRAEVDLRLGGHFELHVDPTAPAGKQGMEGKHILSYVPLRMLAYEGPSRPSMFPPAPESRTWVVWRFEPLEGQRVRIRYTGLGWGTSEEWDRACVIQDHATDRVMETLRRRFVDGPIQWKSEPAAGED